MASTSFRRNISPKNERDLQFLRLAPPDRRHALSLAGPRLRRHARAGEVWPLHRSGEISRQRMNAIFNFFASLRLTVVTLSLSLVLVLVGTLAQVKYGLYIVQEKYFARE